MASREELLYNRGTVAYEPREGSDRFVALNGHNSSTPELVFLNIWNAENGSNVIALNRGDFIDVINAELGLVHPLDVEPGSVDWDVEILDLMN